jgi:cytochrome P460
MRHKKIVRAILIAGIALSGLVGIRSMAQQNKDTVRVLNGLALSEFRGYENWQSVAPSHTDSTNVMRLILANPLMISAYRTGVPGNGRPFPDGSKIAKILWEQKNITDPPFSGSAPDTVPGKLTELEFIEKDSKNFPDTHGWGFAAFKYDAATDRLTPVTSTDKPPQANDAKCGATCHAMAASTDYIFTAYPRR